MSIVTAESCPACNGTGSVVSSVSLGDDLEKELDYLITTAKHQKISVVTNPYLAAYLCEGFPSRRMKWFFKYKKWVDVKPDVKMGMLDYTFLDKAGEEIDTTHA